MTIFLQRPVKWPHDRLSGRVRRHGGQILGQRLAAHGKALAVQQAAVEQEFHQRLDATVLYSKPRDTFLFSGGVAQRRRLESSFVGRGIDEAARQQRIDTHWAHRLTRLESFVLSASWARTRSLEGDDRRSRQRDLKAAFSTRLGPHLDAGIDLKRLWYHGSAGETNQTSAMVYLQARL